MQGTPTQEGAANNALKPRVTKQCVNATHERNKVADTPVPRLFNTAPVQKWTQSHQFDAFPLKQRSLSSAYQKIGMAEC